MGKTAPDQRNVAAAEENPHPLCPRCGQSDRTQNIGRIYFDGLAGKSQQDPSEAGRPVISTRGLSQRLSPPSVGRPSVWGSLSTVQPDLTAIVFAVAGLFLLDQAVVALPSALLPGAVILILAIVAYLAVRRRLIDRYRIARAAQEQSRKAIQEATQRWSRLVYCARDDAIFDPDSGRSFPVEQLQDYLSGRI